MPASAAFRSVATGVAAALVVVGAYAWGRGHAAAAAPASSLPAASGSGSLASSSSPGVSVSGTGRVTGTPSLLRLQTSVSIVKPDVTTALQAANETMAAVQKALKDDGVAAADLQTSGLSVQPDYTYPNGGAHLNGYRVSENLSVVLRDLGKAGSIISDAVAAGGDALQLGGATLDLDQEGALVAQARQNAFADAKAKAEGYAKAAGRSLGAVTSISESDSGAQPIAYPLAARSSAAAAPVPIQAGSQDVTVNVAVTWALS